MKLKTLRAGSIKTGEKDTVNEFMQQLEHPLKNEMQAVRTIIKNADKKIAERIKWNAPSYYYLQDLATFNPRATMHVHLVFHNAAIVKIKSPLLHGDYKDRRMMYFTDMKEVNNNKKALQDIICELVCMMDKNAKQ